MNFWGASVLRKWHRIVELGRVLSGSGIEQMSLEQKEHSTGPKCFPRRNLSDLVKFIYGPLIMVGADETRLGQASASTVGENEDDLLTRLSNPTQVCDFQRNKLEKDAKKNWDLFYKRNGNRFFKNRYWTRHEFVELFGPKSFSGHELRYLLEIGCGCGNLILPLLADRAGSRDGPESLGRGGELPVEDLFIYCTDISDVAIKLLQSNPAYQQHQGSRIFAFVSDITVDVDFIKKNLAGKLMDFVSLVFVLSALEPSKMNQAVAAIAQLLKPGGLVLFRDYAIHDKAMLRFSEESKISDQFYVRQDGTRAYFFTKSQLVDLFESHHLACQAIDYIRTETFNNATKARHSRIFLQAKFRRKGDQPTV